MADVAVSADLYEGDGKVSKSSVNYSVGGDHCGACRFFTEQSEEMETGSCTKVRGEIEEDFWCELFKRKTGKDEKKEAPTGAATLAREEQKEFG